MTEIEARSKIKYRIEFSKEDMQKIVDEKVAQIELDIQEIRNKAIDEFVSKISQEFTRNDEDGNLYIYLWIDEFKKIAERMKGGETDEG